jgi:hypothetical protein
MRLIPGTSDFVEANGTASCVASYHPIASARPADPNVWQASLTRLAIGASAAAPHVRGRSTTFSGSACSCVVAEDISERYPNVNT